MSLCEMCRRWADTLAKLQTHPAVWQLMIGIRARRFGHWAVHDELRKLYAAVYGDTAA